MKKTIDRKTNKMYNIERKKNNKKLKKSNSFQTKF